MRAAFRAEPLADHIGLIIYQADKATKKQGTNVNDYLFKVTGWKASSGKRPRYYQLRINTSQMEIKTYSTLNSKLINPKISIIHIFIIKF